MLRNVSENNKEQKHIIHIISNIKKTCDKLTSTSVNIDGEADKLSKIKELFNLDSSENAYMNIRGFPEKEEKRLKKDKYLFKNLNQSGGSI